MTDAGGLWGSVVGQSAATELLRSHVRRDEVAHAWLFLGPADVGQVEACRAITADLNCPEASGGTACGVCNTCARIAKGTHPCTIDFLPEGAEHLVQHVRDEWIAEASRTTLEGRRKILRVTYADRMNVAAQNAFLKMLEEPPASTIWILEAEEDSLLLDTVLSRCARVNFLAWGREDLGLLADDLGLAGPLREAAMRGAAGSPKRLRMLAEPNVAAARLSHLGVVGRLRDEGPGALVPIVRDVSDWARGRSKERAEENVEELAELEAAFGESWPPGLKTRVKRRHERDERQERLRAYAQFLEDFGSYLRDLLAHQAGASEDQLINVDFATEIAEDAAHVPVGVAADAMRALIECRAVLLDVNAQPEIQIERVLLRLAVPLARAA